MSLLNEKNFYSIFKVLWSKKRRNDMFKIFIGESNFTSELWNEFFQLIRVDEGLKVLTRWINETFRSSQAQVSNSDSPLASPKTPKSITNIYEDVFVLIFENLTNMKDYQILDLYDILSAREGYVDVDTIYVLLCLFISKEGKCLVQFLAQFGDCLFEIFSSVGHKSVGYFLNFDDLYLTNCTNQLKLKITDGKLNLEDFTIFYYFIFKSSDKK